MEGIIYKVQSYKENARLLFVYTPKGKKTLLAHGAQKINNPNRILAQYLTKIQFRDKDRSFVTLAEAKIIDDYAKIKVDYEQTKCVALILEIIDQFIVDDYNHKQVFDQVDKALQSKHLKEASLSFAIKVLKPLGVPVNLEADGRKVRGVNIEKGGLVYQGEEEIIDLDIKDTILMLKLNFVPYSELKVIDETIVGRIENFIIRYYQFHLQSTLKNL